MSTDYNKLFFDSIEFKASKSEILLVPHFICPKCRRYTKGRISTDSPRHSLKHRIPISLGTSAFDFNKKVTFKMPCCGTKISLYVAVHKNAEEREIALYISRLPIPEDWYRTERE